MTHFGQPELSFDYPAGWYAGNDDPGRHTPGGYEPFVYLSSQPLGPDCRPLPHGETCGLSLALGGPLQPGGIVVIWLGVGDRGFLVPGPMPARVAGHPARIDATTPDPRCTALGADHNLVAVMWRSDKAPTANMRVTACWRGPNEAAREAQVHAILASAVFT